MGTHVVIDDQGQVQKALDHKMHLASRQAKATKDYSPLWEGVINLPEPSPDVTPAHQIQIVRQWCKDYEAMTGHKVLRADVHLDEGYIDADGKPHFNAHAHVMCDRTDEKGRVKKLTSTVLREVQNMTAEVTTLQRGIDSRKTGRKHIGHQHFRFDAEKNRLDVEKPKADLARLQKKSKEWSDADLSKIKDLQAKLDGEPARQAAALAAQKLQLDEQYRLDREALKASGEATQRDYQALKEAHEAALAKLKNQDLMIGNLLKNEAVLREQVPGLVAQVKALTPEAARVPDLVEQLKASQEQAAQVPDLVNKLKAQATINGNLLLNEDAAHKRHLSEIERLKAEYAAERAALKASGEATQRDYQQLKKAHEAALADLAKAQQQAEKVPDLVEQVKALKPEADKVPGLLADLATTQQQAQQVPGLVEQLKASQEQATQKTQEIGQISTDLATAQERYTTLHTKALAIQEQRNDLAKKVDTMTQENQRLQMENQRLAERREAASRITLQTLKTDFGVDITSAAKLKGEALEKWREAAEDKVFEQQLAEMKPPAPAKRPAEAQKRPVEAPKLSKAPSPSPIQEKPLVERLAASWQAMLEWVKAIGGVHEPVQPAGLYIGPVLHADELHCIQKTGRRYAVHELAKLDAVPALDDPKMEIQYRDGKGHVSGRTVPGLQR
jgi:myosin heavy subunit